MPCTRRCRRARQERRVSLRGCFSQRRLRPVRNPNYRSPFRPPFQRRRRARCHRRASRVPASLRACFRLHRWRDPWSRTGRNRARGRHCRPLPRRPSHPGVRQRASSLKCSRLLQLANRPSADLQLRPQLRQHRNRSRRAYRDRVSSLECSNVRPTHQLVNRLPPRPPPLRSKRRQRLHNSQRGRLVRASLPECFRLRPTRRWTRRLCRGRQWRRSLLRRRQPRDRADRGSSRACSIRRCRINRSRAIGRRPRRSRSRTNS